MHAAHDLAEQDTDDMRQEIDCTRSAMADKLEALENRVMGTVHSAQETVVDSIQMAKDTVATVKRTFDIKHHVEQHPWLMVGGCALAGLALGSLFLGMRRRSRQAPPDSTPANRPGFFDQFPEEIDKVKGMAIGYVMGLVRDSIKDAVPQVASQIDDVMNSVTTKLGSKPVPQHSLPAG